MYIYIVICLIQATRDPRFCGSVDVHSTKIIVDAREATTYHRQVNRASHATRAALWSRDAWVFRAAPLHCSIVRVQCTQTRDPTRREYWDICTLDLRAPLRSLNHRPPPIGKRIRPRLTKPLCKWIHGRHPRSLARLWSLARYIHAYILREKEEKREGGGEERLRLGLN